MKKQFWKNVLPAMLAFAFSGIYVIVDGFFVGRSVGDLGLAAINIAYPITALIQAIGTGIGMGGAISLAIAKGRGRPLEAKACLGGALALMAAACLAFTFLLTQASPALLRAFGAQGELYALAQEYIRVICLGASMQILSTGLTPIVRNCGGALTAMLSMIGGFIANIYLDYLFVFALGRGIAGAALATVIGQGVTLVPLAVYLIKKGGCSFSLKRLPKDAGRILLVGLSPFGLTLSPNIVLMLMNQSALTQGGERAVSTYAVISYVVCIVQLLLQGVGDGCQPLISRYFGEKDRQAVRTLRRMSSLFALSVSLVCLIAVYFARESAAVFFGASQEVAAAVSDGMRYFLPGFLFAAVLRADTSYLYATLRNKEAYLLIYGEPLMLLCLLSILPAAWGLSGVWASVPITQALLAAAGTWLSAREGFRFLSPKSRRKGESPEK